MAEWDQGVAQAMEIEGYSLYGGTDNDRKLDSLVGTPFLLKNATFRQGDITPQGATEPRDYVSCEVLIHPDHAAKFPRKYVVFNDGSTGIYRQIVAAVAAKGLTDLDMNKPEAGDANTTRFDVSFSTDGESTEFHGLNIFAPEGLRKSDYPNEFGGGSATTWYLA
jgi:hypothetical protein